MSEHQQPAQSILVVEDDPSAFGLIRLYIRRAKLCQDESKDSVIWAKTLAEGIALTRSHKPDVALLDLSLPDSSGLATVQAMRSALPEVPIIVLTGNDDNDLAVAVLESGAQDYLIKGQFDHNALGRAVRYAQVRNTLENRLRLFEKALNSTANGVLITGVDARIQWANPAFTQLTGFELEEIIGRNLNELIKSGQQDKQYYRQMWQTILSGQVWQGEIVNRRKDGTLYNEALMIAPVVSDSGALQHFVAIKQDITERKAAEREIKRLAFYDPLTLLPNRRLLDDRIQQMFALCQRRSELAAVCVLDLDGFKRVNDTLGHKAGDQLLQEAAQRLLECVRQEDTVARLGGDEFVLLLGGLKHVNDCNATLDRIIAMLAAPYSVTGRIAQVSASAGVCLFPSDGNDPDQLLRHADQTMYEAKKAGKNRYQLFDASHDKQQRSQQDTLKKIGKALDKGQIVLFYQPKIDCRQGKVVGVEAQARWDHPILGMLAPSEFIPLLEHDDLIVALGEWAIKEALRQIIEWRAADIDLKISLNLSARQLHQRGFPQRLREMLADYDTDVIKQLEIEIDEAAAQEEVSAVSDAINACRAMGIRVTLDSFGSGFSFVTRLMKRLSADELKISQGFITGMLTDPGDLAIIKAVISLAASFRHKVNAEGVETVDHILMLMGLGCDVMQGVALAQPMSAERLATWLRAFAPDPLWSLFASPRPSRDYFELLLAEANHRHWIDQAITHCANPNDYNSPTYSDAPPLQDHQQCRFGQWYYSDGMRRFHNVNEFCLLDDVHQRIHQTAARLREHYCLGNEAEARADEALLLTQQDEMTGLLRSLRAMLADNLLGHHPGTPF